MATAPQNGPKVKKPVKPAAPRTFFLIYKGQLEGEPTVTFDKMAAMDLLVDANEKGDTTFKMKKITLPKTTRVKKTDPAAPSA